jgi:hypothetical protein
VQGPIKAYPLFIQGPKISVLCHRRDFHGHPEILHIIQKPMYERELDTISLFYQLVSFSSCFAHLETKLSVRSLLRPYELSQ